MTHHTTRGATHDGRPWAITLHGDQTASAMMVTGTGLHSITSMSHDAARYLIGELPNLDSREDDIHWECSRAKRMHPIPPAVTEARTWKWLGRVTG